MPTEVAPKNHRCLSHGGEPTSLKVGDFISFRIADGAVSFLREDGTRISFPDGDHRFLVSLHPRMIDMEEAFSIARLIGMVMGCGIEKAVSISSGCHTFRFVP